MHARTSLTRPSSSEPRYGAAIITTGCQDGAEGARLGHDRDVTGLAELAAPRERALAVVVAAVLVAATSAFVVAPAPSYDPWTWLLWGREVAGLELSTRRGPGVQAAAGGRRARCCRCSARAAPAAWVLVARAGAVLALWFAFPARARAGGNPRRCPRRAGRGLLRRLPGYAAAGAETGWTIALGPGCLWPPGVRTAARGAGASPSACALLRVEAWPFLLVAGALLWRRRPQDRVLLAVCAVVVPALWFVPEWLGFGRCAALGRARPGAQPGPARDGGRAGVGGAARGRGAAAVAVVGRRCGGGACRPRSAARWSSGLAWIALVAVMAQGGFSGEPRYSLPGGALLAIAGAAGLTGLLRERRALWLPLAVVASRSPLAPEVDRLDDLRREQAWQWSLAQTSSGRSMAGGRRAAGLRTPVRRAPARTAAGVPPRRREAPGRLRRRSRPAWSSARGCTADSPLEPRRDRVRTRSSGGPLGALD